MIRHWTTLSRNLTGVLASSRTDLPGKEFSCCTPKCSIPPVRGGGNLHFSLEPNVDHASLDLPWSLLTVSHYFLPQEGL